MSYGHLPERIAEAGSVSRGLTARIRPGGNALHRAWRAFLHFCSDLQHGEIERLRIQDGVPVLGEVVKKKVKFTE